MLLLFFPSHSFLCECSRICLCRYHPSVQLQTSFVIKEVKWTSKSLSSLLWILSPRPKTYVGKTYRLKVKTCMACWKQLTIKHNSLSSSTQHSALQQRALQSDNLEYYTLVRWDKRFVDQASDVPSISFLCQNPFNSFFFLFFLNAKMKIKRRGVPSIFSFEYNLSPNLISK